MQTASFIQHPNSGLFVYLLMQSTHSKGNQHLHIYIYKNCNIPKGTRCRKFPTVQLGQKGSYQRKVLVSVFGSVGNQYSRYLTLRAHEKALTLHVDLGKTNEILLKQASEPKRLGLTWNTQLITLAQFGSVKLSSIFMVFYLGRLFSDR